MKLLKKGQGEIVGLLVIVLLLLFVGIIFLRFYIAQPSTSLSHSRQSIEASNALNALMKVSINGEPLTAHTDACNSDKNLCDGLQNEIEAILGYILKQGQKYSFTLSTGAKTLIEISQCTTGIVSTYSFIEANIFYDVTLKIC
tara:strand:+ start:821 stop:1249 length:429 start_codon:yes stop_codon:yes gene_type:complete